MSRNILTSRHSDSLRINRLGRGTHSFKVHVSPNPFVSGSYPIRLSCFGFGNQEHDAVDFAYSLNVVPNLEEDTLSRRPGIVRLPFEWSLESAQ
jgi:hypothetical protein